MYQVLVNIEKSISDVNGKKIVENVTVSLKKKFHQIITVKSLSGFFFNSNFRKC